MIKLRVTAIIACDLDVPRDVARSIEEQARSYENEFRNNIESNVATLITAAKLPENKGTITWTARPIGVTK